MSLIFFIFRIGFRDNYIEINSIRAFHDLNTEYSQYLTSYYALRMRTRPISPVKSPSPILRPIRASTPVYAENGLLKTVPNRCTTPESTITTDKTEMESYNSLPGISSRNTIRALRCRLTKLDDDLNANKKLVTGMSHKYTQMKALAKQERKEKLALARRISELENAMRMMSFSGMQVPGSTSYAPQAFNFNPYAFMPSASSDSSKKETDSIESIEIPLYLK